MKKSNLTKSNLIDTKEINFSNEMVLKLHTNNYYITLLQKVDNSDVSINHLENIFTDETYYLAMKIVPLLERKVLYLSYVENLRLNDICKRLKLQKKQVIALRNKAIVHFRNNLATIEKANRLKTGGKK